MILEFSGFSIQEWIEKNRHLLKPPVSNKVIWKDRSLIAMIVGGPNSRTDFHVNQTDEFFYQLEGEMHLKIIDHQKRIRRVPIRAGEIFMLPSGTPHSPQRNAGSIGLVIERRRGPQEQDGLQWYCEKCNSKLYEEFFNLTNIETQFAAVFERFYNSSHVKCRACGHTNGRTWTSALNETSEANKSSEVGLNE